MSVCRVRGSLSCKDPAPELEQREDDLDDEYPDQLVNETTAALPNKRPGHHGLLSPGPSPQDGIGVMVTKRAGKWISTASPW